MKLSNKFYTFEGKIKNMKENEPEQYKAYLEKMRIYLKARRDKLRELKNSKN